MKKLCLHIVYLSLMLIAPAVQAADVVLVVGKQSPIENLSRSEVEDIFQGKITRLPNIEKITPLDRGERSEEHTSELQSLMSISYAVFCLKKKTTTIMKCVN